MRERERERERERCNHGKKTKMNMKLKSESGPPKVLRIKTCGEVSRRLEIKTKKMTLIPPKHSILDRIHLDTYSFLRMGLSQLKMA